ncbi:MAG: TlpA disulfide reductase family protein [Desulfobacterales bacterium]|jgi:peroxiredoxin
MSVKDVKKNRRFSFQSLVIIVLIVILVGILILLQTKDSLYQPSGVQQLTKGRPAPNFSLPGLDGQTVSLTDYKDKVVLLNIWATWCPPCVEEMPSMEKLYQELGGDGFEILAVSIDESGSKDVRPFMKKHKLSFPALTDQEGTIKGLYQTTGVPESFVIDKDGTLLEIVIGPRDWAAPEVVRYFQNLIATD